jgi:uncharacterized protein (TIGR02594 family)
VIDPIWLARARDFIGLQEIKGPQHNAEIVSWWRDSHLPWIRDDETAYCSAFVNAMLERSLITSPRAPNARSYTDWGMDVLDLGREQIPLGAIVVYSRPPDPKHGHVGFACGITAEGNILTLGANQSDSVSISPFKTERLIAARWPNEERVKDLKLLRRIPFVSTSTPVSTREA